MGVELGMWPAILYRPGQEEQQETDKYRFPAACYLLAAGAKETGGHCYLATIFVRWRTGWHGRLVVARR
jgi:hypothetical protein